MTAPADSASAAFRVLLRAKFRQEVEVGTSNLLMTAQLPAGAYFHRCEVDDQGKWWAVYSLQRTPRT